MAGDDAAGSRDTGEHLSPWPMPGSAPSQPALPVGHFALPVVVVRPLVRPGVGEDAALVNLLDAVTVGPRCRRPVELVILGPVPLVQGLRLALMILLHAVALGLERRPQVAGRPLLLGAGRDMGFVLLIGAAGDRLKDALQPSGLR